MRAYERSHPWLTFRLDLSRASYQLWLLLGEAQSKSQHVVGTPLTPALQQQFHSLYLAKGAHATTAIEGNTLTEEQVRQHLDGKLKVPPSQEYLKRELDNITAAFNEIAKVVFDEQRRTLTAADVLAYNARVLAELAVEDGVVPGALRTHSVGVAGYRGAPAEDCAYLLERLCTWLNDELHGPKEFEVAFGILKAIVAHVYSAWIHPFGDGNGRTARLLEFRILIAVGVPSTAAHLLSNHYSKTRAEYYRQLDHAHRSGGDLLPFIEYALRGFIEGLREQIQRLRLQQRDICWRDYVHERFRGRRSDGDKRRRDLALAISVQGEPTPSERLKLLTPEIAALYATKSDKTFVRDIRELIAMDLLEATDQGLRARKEIMSAFTARQAVGSRTALR
jgi:Fic family protein